MVIKIIKIFKKIPKKQKKITMFKYLEIILTNIQIKTKNYNNNNLNILKLNNLKKFEIFIYIEKIKLYSLFFINNKT